jgi:hypothetical protein
MHIFDFLFVNIIYNFITKKIEIIIKVRVHKSITIKIYNIMSKLIGVGVGIVALAAVPIIVGFGTGGIVAGSIAAGIQSGIGNVAAGSTFATLTSWGMTGKFIALGKVGISTIGAGVAKLFRRRRNNH